MDFALAIDHVQVAMPVGGEERARAFFGALLGLTELPKPADMAVRGGCWFALGDRQLHLGAETDFRPAKKAHVALALDGRSEEHTSELQSLMRISYAVFCLKKKTIQRKHNPKGIK